MLLCSSSPMAAASKDSSELLYLFIFFVVLDKQSLPQMVWEFM